MYDKAGKLKKMKHEQLKEADQVDLQFANPMKLTMKMISLFSGSWHQRSQFCGCRSDDDVDDVRCLLSLGDEQCSLESFHRSSFVRTGW